MKKGITLMDGAVGTSLWAMAEERGIAKVPVWRYNVEHPELIEQLTKEYVDAGAEIILANTFGANGPMVRRSSSYDPAEVIASGVRAAKNALRGSGKKLALSIGPLSTMLEPFGDTTEEEAAEIFRVMLDAGMKEGPDLILVQTFIDLAMMEVAAREAMRYGVPVFCCMTFEKKGRTMFGNSVEDVIETLEPLGISGIGLNCSLGPDLAVPVMREFVGKTSLPLVFKPNAGKPILAPDGTTSTAFSVDEFVEDIAPALEFVDYIGGCCGSDPSYVRALKARIEAG